MATCGFPVESARRKVHDRYMHVRGPRIAGRRDGSAEPPPPFGHRLQVRMHRRRIDQELAAGTAIGDSTDRALRAAQLAEPRARRRLAASLRQIVDETLDPRASVLAVVPPARTTVLPWSEGLLGLAERIERPGPLGAQGLARATLLVSDGAGPLYHPGAEQPLGDAIWSIAEGLQPCGRHRAPAPRGRSGPGHCCPVCGAVDAAYARGPMGRRRR